MLGKLPYGIDAVALLLKQRARFVFRVLLLTKSRSRPGTGVTTIRTPAALPTAAEIPTLRSHP
jgi:hypothetical protein